MTGIVSGAMSIFILGTLYTTYMMALPVATPFLIIATATAIASFVKYNFWQQNVPPLLFSNAAPAAGNDNAPLFYYKEGDTYYYGIGNGSSTVHYHNGSSSSHSSSADDDDNESKKKGKDDNALTGWGAIGLGFAFATTPIVLSYQTFREAYRTSNFDNVIDPRRTERRALGLS